jgi:hypothetical protein
MQLPVALTRGDQIAVPVAVYNYLPEAQTVTLTLQSGSGLAIVGSATQSITLEAEEVRGLNFTIQAAGVGTHALTIQGLATGGEADAVVRSLRVSPDGDAQDATAGGRLEENLTASIAIPVDAIPGGSSMQVKIYPGYGANVVEGMDAVFSMPGGCFEQTTSQAWPNVMAMHYMEATGTITPEIKEQAMEYIEAGYQRILTFESPTGGYNWWGDSTPGNRILTAIALMQFADLRELIETDPVVTDRHRTWLVSQQAADGSWAGGDALHAGNEALGEDVLRTTAFIAWALHQDGGAPDAVSSAVGYVKNALSSADDLYAKAVAANALARAAPADAMTSAVLQDLADAVVVVDDETVKWTFESNSWTGCSGDGGPGEVEITGLVVTAFVEAGVHGDLVDKALAFLAGAKDAFGNWYSTQATVNSLRALTAAVSNAGDDANAVITVNINGQAAGTVSVTPETSNVHHTVDLTANMVAGANSVSLEFAGTGRLLYQVVGRYYAPWSAQGPEVTDLDLNVSYDQTNVAVDDVVNVTAAASNLVPNSLQDQVIVRMGVAPGFDVVTEDLQALVAMGQVARFERDALGITFYLMAVSDLSPRVLNYRMIARTPAEVKAPPARVYSYYQPEVGRTLPTVDFTISE